MSTDDLQAEYDFTRGTRGPVVPVPTGKTRITIRIDDDILEWFRQRVEQQGGGNYQTLLNSALRDYLDQHALEEMLRRVVREELLYRRQQLLQATNAAYAVLRSDPAAWAALQQEQASWDHTVGDGVADE